jgi:uncharacterized protein (DUF3820 family)
MKLTFGKFKDEEIENVPTSYLNWLAENLVLPDNVQEEIQNQIKLRSGEGIVRDKMYLDKHRMGDE